MSPDTAIPVDGICIRAVMTSSAQDVTVGGDLERKRVAVAMGNHGERLEWITHIRQHQ